METNADSEMWVTKLIMLTGLAAVIMALLSGCSGSTGWQVGFGVYPVTAIQNQQSLKPEVRMVKDRSDREKESF